MYKIALIGAMYGDEGKGLMTDYFCNKMLNYGLRNGAVVRFQGGAQAGHTVVTPNGQRHIFSHFGSGTLLGVKTILSSDFVCNPMLFLTELYELKTKYSFEIDVKVEAKSYISTIYDVMLNQQTEINRLENKHGSVGVGFGETIERNEKGISLCYEDLFSSHKLLGNKLSEIRNYFLETCKERNIIISNLMMEDYTDIMLDCLMRFKDHTKPELTSKRSYDFLIFEGSQGLGLDINYGAFPHVTRSKTGIHNAEHFCKYYDLGKIDEVYYITRSYTTRHGAGPLRGESRKDFDHIIDDTNKENLFQGKLRFAPLDTHRIVNLIKLDSASLDVFVGLVMTCMDQVKGMWKIQDLNITIPVIKSGFEELIRNCAKIVSYGPTRLDVVESIGNQDYSSLAI